MVASRRRKGGAFVYAIDRDGRTYGEDDLNNVKETDFSFTKRGVALAQPVAFSKAQDEAKRVISGKYPSVSATFTEQVDKARTFGKIEELLDKAHQDFVKLKPKSNPHINENQDTKGNDGEPNEQDPISDEKQKQPSGNRSRGSCFLRDGLVAFMR